jgi:peptidoglycan/LPS O-acetylase OafA/YrhL
MSHSQKYDALEALRGLAALTVFLGHLYTKTEGLPHSNILSFALNWGTEAVIIFFILSGVVIHLSQEKRPKTCLEFSINRLVRIYPLYVLAVILAVGVMLFRGHEALSSQITGNLLFLQTLQGFIVRVIPTNEALWSLSSEMFFYFLFALSLLNRRFLSLWCALAIISVVFYSSILSWGWLGYIRLQFAYSCIWLFGYALATWRHEFRFERPFAISLIPLALMWARTNFISDFYDIYRFIGFAVFCLPLFNMLISRSERTIKVPWWVALGCLVTSLAVFWILSRSLLSTKIMLSALSIAAILLVYILPRLFEHLWNLLAKAKCFLVYIGSISYAIYIIHLPILYFLQAVLPAHPLLSVAITFIVVLVISHVLERILQPKLTLLLKRASRLRAVPAPTIVS